MPRYLIIALATALAGSAMAQPAPGPASHDPATVQAGAYKIEPEHTQVTFTVSHLGFSEYSGRFSGVGGSLQLDPAQIGAARLEVTLPTASVSTPSEKLTNELRSADWLDADRFAQVRFRTTQVTSTGEGQAKIEGELTMHGVTQPLTLQARFVGAGINPLTKTYTVGFQATGTLSRSAFGVKKYVPLIGDDVTLTISGAFEKAN